MRRFYAPVENFLGQDVILSEDETRHLRDVLRLRVGDDVSVFDGLGREFKCAINAIDKKTATLSLVEEITPASPESNLELKIVATVLPGDKYDLVIQKAVELGVVELTPLSTKRCEVKLKDAAKRLDRWRRIAFEASKQCGRAKLMTVNEPIEFTELLSNASDSFLLFSEREGESFETISECKKITAIFGPKGGWDDHELQDGRAKGMKVVTLGGRVLRAETAVIAISAVLQHRFGDFN
ncbi:MAG: 16S rRNA (uracil(1498)-N(3))-methyltransferase [Pyrinomonadaceae bacterium]